MHFSTILQSLSSALVSFTQSNTTSTGNVDKALKGVAAAAYVLDKSIRSVTSLVGREPVQAAVSDLKNSEASLSEKAEALSKMASVCAEAAESINTSAREADEKVNTKVDSEGNETKPAEPSSWTRTIENVASFIVNTCILVSAIASAVSGVCAAANQFKNRNTTSQAASAAMQAAGG